MSNNSLHTCKELLFASGSQEMRGSRHDTKYLKPLFENYKKFTNNNNNKN